MSAIDPRRDIPSVSALLESVEVAGLLARAPRSLVVESIRDVLEDARRGQPARFPGRDEIIAAVEHSLDLRMRPSLEPLINATGIILHTNLGRAPLAERALAALRAVGEGYSNLEYDLGRGARGSRYVHCASMLREITGAEDAIVVNNCAAALVLALNTLANGREAVISRGELVEIGGSFRIPDIMSRSGARLVEVGTTNRTHLDDYRQALGADTGAIVKVHHSNFEITGFVAEASVAELVELAGGQVPVVQDFGSGLLIPLDAWGLKGEPTASQLVAAGPDLVLMSGDKLLGGPQAGIIVGRKSMISRIATNPLTRAFRVDKFTLAALEATLAMYREPTRALEEVPVLRMITTRADELRERAEGLVRQLEAAGVEAEVLPSVASVGGGAYPGSALESWAVSPVGRAAEMEKRLRAADVPVIARVTENRMLLDLRSVPASQDVKLATVLPSALRA